MNQLAIGVADMLSYLNLAGWKRDIAGPLIETWQHPRLDYVQVLVPKVQTAPDFVNRVAMLTRELAEVERRSPEAVMDDISRQFLDVADLRVEHPDATSDTIPLEAGYAVFTSAKQLVVAAAGATLRRQAHFGRSMPTKARRHTNSVRLGHTKRGSYVVPIISHARIPDVPTFDDHPHLELAVEEALFDRRVMTTMSQALGVLEEMTVRRDRAPSRSEIHGAIGDGVSRELCQAVDQIIGTDTVAELSFDFRWAPAVNGPARAHNHVVFPDEARPLVEAVSKQLRTARDEHQSVLFGVITDLSSGTDELGVRVAIETVVDGRKRKVWFDLGEDDYEVAIRCFKRQPVVARGTLTTAAGRRPSMQVSFFGPDTSITPPLQMDETAT